MSRTFNSDGSVRPCSPRGEHTIRGHKQDYSIFGWADEKYSLKDAQSEAQRQQAAIAAGKTSPRSKIAGVKTRVNDSGAGPTRRPVSAQRLHDIQGHGIFDDGDAPRHKQVSEAKRHQIQGTYQFASPEPYKPAPIQPGSPRAKKQDSQQSTVFSVAADTLQSRHVSEAKKANLSESRASESSAATEVRTPEAAEAGHWNKVVDGPRRLSRPGGVARQPPGGRSQLTLW